MVCEHLKPLEEALHAAGIRETARGQLWSKNCREFVYFNAVLDIETLKARFTFAPCVEVSENLDPRSGTERGFWCSEHQDGVMGALDGAPRFAG
jgi:hypothetical protein